MDPHPAYASLALGKGGLHTATTLLHKQLKNDGMHRHRAESRTGKRPLSAGSKGALGHLHPLRSVERGTQLVGRHGRARSVEHALIGGGGSAR